jgi:hypothetical protein
MSRDIESRIRLFLGKDYDYTGDIFGVDRIALNRDQIDAFNPPPNPAKTTDSRYESYIGEHGTESWELDALEPSVLDGLVRDQLLLYRDTEAWDERVALEEEGQADILYIANNYQAIREFLEERDR